MYLTQVATICCGWVIIDGVEVQIVQAGEERQSWSLERCYRRWIDHHRLLDQTVKQFTAKSGRPTIEPERILVQVIRQV